MGLACCARIYSVRAGRPALPALICPRRYAVLPRLALCCSGADVAALTQLTCLTYLDLRRQEYASQDAHPPELVRQLREALPMCQVLV